MTPDESLKKSAAALAALAEEVREMTRKLRERELPEWREKPLDRID